MPDHDDYDTREERAHDTKRTRRVADHPALTAPALADAPPLESVPRTMASAEANALDAYRAAAVALQEAEERKQAAARAFLAAQTAWLQLVAPPKADGSK